MLIKVLNFAFFPLNILTTHSLIGYFPTSPLPLHDVVALQDYKPPDEGPGEYQTIPLDKIEDFGVHCRQYYSLEVSYFKSSLDSHLLDLLWNKYWVNTLSSCSLLTVSWDGTSPSDLLTFGNVGIKTEIYTELDFWFSALC